MRVDCPHEDSNNEELVSSTTTRKKVSYIDADITILSADRRHFRAESKGVGPVLTVQ